MKSRFTLRQRLLLLTAVALLPAFLIIAASQLSSRATRTREIDDEITRITDIVRGEVIRGMTGAATMMVAMGRSALTDPESATDCDRYAASVQQDFPTIVDVAIADASGTLYCHS
ncbi:MAG TPA: hypothetical protein VFO41_16870, partial [Alphaproteobacteria bacterium]|nr:hypothetical protein [Alphaproteobacteria bacterium]